MPNLLLTTVCNRQCPYCFAAGELTARSGARSLSLSDLDWALAFLSRGGVRQVGLLGGEPTLHPHFPEVIEQVCRAGFRCQLFTNGLLQPETLTFLESTPTDNLAATVNVNEPRETPAGERERVRAVIARLGQRTCLGFTIYRPDADLEFLLETVDMTGCARRIRLGLAHPIAGAANAHLSLATIRQVGPRLVDFLRHAADRGISVTFDCGFPRCAFTGAELAGLAERQQAIGFYCGPVVDIGPSLDVWRCFPLHGSERKNLRQFADYQAVVRHFAGAFVSLARIGVFPECASCRFLHQRDCAGGCRAHVLRASWWQLPDRADSVHAAFPRQPPETRR